MQIKLDPHEVSQLLKPINGRGGWQTLLRRLQAQLHDGVLTLTAHDIGRIARYRDRYGDGGWQGRLRFLRRVELDSAA